MMDTRGRFTAGAVLVLAFVTLQVVWYLRPVPAAGKEGETCAYGAAYGMVYDLVTGDEVKVTPDTVGPTMTQVRNCAEDRLADAERSRYAQQSQLLPIASAGAHAMERDIVLVELAAAISVDVTVDEQSRITRRLLAQIGGSNVNEIVEHSGARDLLAANGWVRQTPGKYAQYVKQYLDNCRTAQVPVPDAISSGGHWSSPFDLAADAGKYFFGKDIKKKLTLWKYDAGSQGMCVTLLREAYPDEHGNQPVPLIGTICTDAGRKYACFFDNIVYGKDGSTRRIDEATMLSTNFDQLAHPADYDDDCNLCHLGDNPLIVHPGMRLGEILNPHADKTNSDQFAFVEFGAPLLSWINPAPADSTGEGGACMRCHDIPRTRTSYCSTVLGNAANDTMPPSWPHGENDEFWPDKDGCFSDSVSGLKKYFASMRRLKSICDGVPEKSCSDK